MSMPMSKSQQKKHAAALMFGLLTSPVKSHLPLIIEITSSKAFAGRVRKKRGRNDRKYYLFVINYLDLFLHAYIYSSGSSILILGLWL